MNIDDINLIKNILNGDLKSENILYDKYKIIIKDVLVYKYGNYQYIEDDISEILNKIFAKLSYYDESKSQFKTWVFNIVKNYMIDKNRKKSIPDSLYISDNDINLKYLNEDVNNVALYSNDLHTIDNVEISNTLDYIKNQIPICDYNFLDLKYNQGYNYCEIGCVYNMTSSTISNKVNYIKQKIKNTLTNEGID